MQGKCIKWVCLTILVCIIVMLLAGVSGDPEEAAAEQLLKRRANIMENILSGKISYEDGRKQLMEVEADKQYTDDLDRISEYIDSDYEKVIKMKVISIEEVSHVSKLITFETSICWTMLGYNGIYDQKTDYYVGMKEEDGGYKIVSIDLLNQ